MYVGVNPCSFLFLLLSTLSQPLSRSLSGSTTSELASLPLFVFDVLPWWIAAPTLQLVILFVGMALDETYVNRTTVLAGALALAVHAVVAGETGLLVGIYLDVGLAIGVYGLYAYVVDAYVGNWFRIAAYFAYSPLAVFLVIILPDVLFPFALAIAGYANLQLMAYLDPTDPYYFGPGSPDEFEAAVETVGAPAEPDLDPAPDARSSAAPGSDSEAPAGGAAGGGSVAAGSTGTNATTAATGASAATDPAPTAATAPADADDRPTERGILPEFMRRL